MTLNSAKSGMSRDEALERLYPDDEVKDLTTESYLAAVARLRVENAAVAKQVERALRPWLAERVFPRRQVGWEATSFGLRARLHLLPENPHVELDVQLIRNTFGIRPEIFHGMEGDSVTFNMSRGEPILLTSDPAVARPVVRRSRATSFLAAQWRFASGRNLEDISGFDLSPEAVEMAKNSAHVDLADSGNPGWLREGVSKGASPLSDAMARLCTRHLLPQALDHSLTYYLLTDDRETITDVNFPAMLLKLSPDESGAEGVGIVDSFSRTVAGIDENLTQEDWDEIWRVEIRPLQAFLLDRRGSKPHGRHLPDLRRLSEAMPIYREVVLHSSKPRDALSALAKQGRGFAEGMDASTALRMVADLRRLLAPKA